MSDETIAIENVNHPGKTHRVNRAKYEAMRAAVLAAAPAGPPGLDYAALKAAVLEHLPETLFPGGEKAGWWLKSVQLDLEAKGLLARDGRPIRWWRVR